MLIGIPAVSLIGHFTYGKDQGSVEKDSIAFFNTLLEAAGTDVPVPGSSAYSFIDPTFIPITKYFCRKG